MRCKGLEARMLLVVDGFGVMIKHSDCTPKYTNVHAFAQTARYSSLGSSLVSNLCWVQLNPIGEGVILQIIVFFKANRGLSWVYTGLYSACRQIHKSMLKIENSLRLEYSVLQSKL